MLNDFSGRPINPVEGVTWYDAIDYANRLSQAEGLDKYYNISRIERNNYGNIIDARVVENSRANGYRLASSEEWEYAARGGRDGRATLYAGSNNLGDVGWYRDNSSVAGTDRDDKRGTMPVGEKEPNELGIYDMSGNVLEWTNDSILRDGSWIDDASTSEVTSTYSDYPSNGHNNRGFRLVRYDD